MAKVSFTTQIKYTDPNAAAVSLPIWVFPQTPPNYLNLISNVSYLRANTTQFTPATKITFSLVLKFNGTLFVNDYLSATRIQVYRSSSLEQVQA